MAVTITMTPTEFGVLSAATQETGLPTGWSEAGYATFSLSRAEALDILNLGQIVREHHLTRLERTDFRVQLYPQHPAKVPVQAEIKLDDSQLVVNDVGFYFEGRLKGSALEIWTRTIGFDTLKRWLETYSVEADSPPEGEKSNFDFSGKDRRYLCDALHHAIADQQHYLRHSDCTPEERAAIEGTVAVWEALIQRLGG